LLKYFVDKHLQLCFAESKIEIKTIEINYIFKKCTYRNTYRQTSATRFFQTKKFGKQIAQNII